MIRKTITLLILAQMIFLSLMIFFPQPVIGQPGAPTVNIALTEQSNTADVGPDDTGECQFNGVVSVDINDATKVIVNIFAADTWDSAVVSPPSMEFTSKSDKNFVVTVWAALGIGFEEVGTVKVFGNWTAFPGNYSGKANPIQGTMGRIDINQFYKFSIESNKTFEELKTGEEDDFELTIFNEGNWLDTFVIEVTNSDELSNKGISIRLEQSAIEIKEFSNETINIIVPISEGTDKGTYEIKLKVSSDKGLMEGVPAQEETYKVTVTKSSSSRSSTPGFETVSLVCVIFLICLFAYKRRIKEFKKFEKRKVG